MKGGTKHLVKTGFRITPKKIRSAFYIEETIYKTLKEASKKYGLNLSDAVNYALLSFLMQEYPQEYMDFLQGRGKYGYTV